MKDSKIGNMPRPSGEIEGNVPDKGVMTGVTDTYMSDLKSGDSGERSIASATKSDAWDRNLPMPAPKI